MNLASPKTIALKNGQYLHFWYANNKGRGTDNCTIVKSFKGERAKYSKLQEESCAVIRTSSWKGKVNFSKNIQEEINVKEDDLILS